MNVISITTTPLFNLFIEEVNLMKKEIISYTPFGATFGGLVEFVLLYFKKRSSIIISKYPKSNELLLLINTLKILFENWLNNLPTIEKEFDVSLLSLFVRDEAYSITNEFSFQDDEVNINEWYDQLLYIMLTYSLTKKIILLIKEKVNQAAQNYLHYFQQNFRVGFCNTTHDTLFFLNYLFGEDVFILIYNNGYIHELFLPDNKTSTDCKQIINNIIVITESIVCTLSILLTKVNIISACDFLPSILLSIKTSSFISSIFNEYKQISFDVKNYKNSFILLCAREDIGYNFKEENIKKRNKF